jgi:hypothetical protein
MLIYLLTNIFSNTEQLEKYCYEILNCKERKKKKPVKENRRVQKIAKIRGDLRRLTATFKKAPKEESP